MENVGQWFVSEYIEHLRRSKNVIKVIENDFQASDSTSSFFFVCFTSNFGCIDAALE